MAMPMLPLISQERVQELTSKKVALQAVVMPDPENATNKTLLMVIIKGAGKDKFEGALSMVGKPEARVFASLESVWKLTRKLGIKSLVVENDNFNGEAA